MVKGQISKWQAPAVPIRMTGNEEEMSIADVAGRQCVAFCSLFFVKITENGTTRAHWSINIRGIRAMNAREDWLENSEILGYVL